MHEEVALAKKIVFLGFGFHEQNMTLLKPDDDIFGSERLKSLVYATACGVSDPNCEVIAQRIEALFSRRRLADKPAVLQIPAATLMADYSMQLRR